MYRLKIRPFITTEVEGIGKFRERLLCDKLYSYVSGSCRFLAILLRFMRSAEAQRNFQVVYSTFIPVSHRGGSNTA
jgi:hypothetical protein